MTTIEAQNKAFVLEAFDTLFNKRDYAAAGRFWSPAYIQHSAHIAPGTCCTPAKPAPRAAGTAPSRPARTTRRHGWHVPLDLEELTLVDAEIVRFLGTCEA